MLDYVLPLSSATGETTGTPSALLNNPAALDGKRAQCASGQPAVLIDLDPGTKLVALDRHLAANADLTRALGYLRADGITLGWISGHPETQRQNLRDLLVKSGLDPEGADPIVLARDDQGRKQDARRAFGSFYCLLAIGGDTRSDFDDVFDYLKNPADAAALSPLIGQGWFLLPNPLSQSL